jgi:DNA-binding NtrC family response regulator
MLIDNDNSSFPPSILICDPQYMTRSSFTLLAKEVFGGEVIEVAEIKTAKTKCERHIFNLIILGLDEQSEAISLIRLIRDNLLLSPKDVPIIVMLEEVTLEKLNELKALNVSEILVKPTRMKTIYDSFSRYL